MEVKDLSKFNIDNMKSTEEAILALRNTLKKMDKDRLDAIIRKVDQLEIKENSPTIFQYLQEFDNNYNSKIMTKNQFVAFLRNFLATVYCITSYSGNEQVMYVQFPVNEKFKLKDLHNVVGPYLGIWNKQRKAASKRIKKDAEYRNLLIQNAVKNLLRNSVPTDFNINYN